MNAGVWWEGGCVRGVRMCSGVSLGVGVNVCGGGVGVIRCRCR